MPLAPELERFIGRRAARRVVVEAIASAAHAFSADELRRMVRACAPRISRSTIYRTLRLLRDQGLVRETVIRGGTRVYQLASDPRALLWICEDCRRIRSTPIVPAVSALVALARGGGIQPGQMTGEIHFRCEVFRCGGVCPTRS